MGDACLGSESACEAISASSVCMSQTDLLTLDPLAGMFFNAGGVCTALDCLNNPNICRDGTECVQLFDLLGGTMPSLCLLPCTDANDCATGMTCNTVVPIGGTGTHCL